MELAQQSSSRHSWTQRVEVEITPRVIAQRRLRTIAAIVLGIATLWAATFAFAGGRGFETLVGGTIVLGPWVVRGTELALGIAVIGVALLLIARRLGTDRDPKYRTVRTWVTWIVALGLPLSLVGSALTDLGQHPTVLSPASDAGCRVVVIEQPGSDHAHIGMLQPGAVSVEWIGWLAVGTDGVMVVSTGDVALDWVGDEATITYAPTTEVDPTVDVGVAHPPLICDA